MNEQTKNIGEKSLTFIMEATTATNSNAFLDDYLPVIFGAALGFLASIGTTFLLSRLRLREAKRAISEEMSDIVEWSNRTIAAYSKIWQSVQDKPKHQLFNDCNPPITIYFSAEFKKLALEDTSLVVTTLSKPEQRSMFRQMLVWIGGFSYDNKKIEQLDQGPVVINSNLRCHEVSEYYKIALIDLAAIRHYAKLYNKTQFHGHKKTLEEGINLSQVIDNTKEELGVTMPSIKDADSRP